MSRGDLHTADKWTVITKAGDYEELGRHYGVSPVIARLMRNRGITNDEEARIFLGKAEDRFNNGALLRDADKFAAAVTDGIRTGKHIRVIGDYDVDGVCSTYIMLKVLKALGAEADSVIPDRKRDGYGLNMRLIEEAKKDGTDIIVTVDNGISAINEIKHAKELGITVLVTDHHEVSFEIENGERIEILPEASAVVDPHRSGCGYPYKNLCGAAVAYRLARVLLNENGVDEEESWALQEMAALATVCDVMPLTGENRSIVKTGLERLKNTENPGLRSLMELNGINGRAVNSFDAGFIIGPCINAAGRLKGADMALDLFMSTDNTMAREMAEELKQLNSARKNMTGAAVEEACRIIDGSDYVNNKVLVILLPECHESIAGIVAGKVREKYYRPALILTDAVTDEGKPCYKGSGRSIEAYNMYEGISEVKDLLIYYGGHSQAAGFSIEKDKLDEFRKRLNENCALTAEEMTRRVKIDMLLPFRYLSIKLVEELNVLEPFGNSNEPPLFAVKDVTIKEQAVLGENRNVFTAFADDGTARVRLKFFGDADGFMNYVNQKKGKLNICYSPEINEFRGNRNLEIRVRYYS